MHQHQRQAEHQGQQGEVAHQPGRLALQGRAFGGDRAQRCADAADAAARPRGRDPRQRVALHEQGARVEHRLVVATRRGAGPWRAGRGLLQLVRQGQALAHRHRFPGEQGLVGAHTICRDEQCIGGHAVALAQLQQVAAHHVTAGNALRAAVAHHQRTRAGEIAQRLDGAFGPAFLEQRQRQRHQHEAEERHSLLQVAEQQVQRARREQQQEHRLAHRLEGDGQQRAVLAARQRIRSVRCEPQRGFGCGEAGLGRRGGDGRLDFGARHLEAAAARSFGVVCRAA